MPELPEVEYAARVLRAAAEGRTIAAVRVRHTALRRGVTSAALRRLQGRRVERVERRGKHQLVHLSGGLVLHVHFRMTGDWHVGRVVDAEVPFARAVIDLHDGTRVSLVDSRALATLAVWPAGRDILPELGPEATDPALDGATLAARLARRRGPIKPALLDQRVVAGLGNIYAAESLWHARLSPTASASRLTPAQLAALVRGMRRTLAAAERRSGRYAEGESSGRFNVYDREGKPCRRCRTPIERIVQAGRSTYFCPRCQPDHALD
jgi:formamidopyrimidine-DNA glycosylase